MRVFTFLLFVFLSTGCSQIVPVAVSNTSTALPPTNTRIPRRTGIPMATPVPAKIDLGTHRGAYNSAFYFVVGELINRGSEAGYVPSMSAKFFDARGRLLAVADGNTLLDLVEPDGKVPFRIILTNPPAGITSYELSKQTSIHSILHYHPVRVTSQQTRDNFGVEVFGEIANEQEIPLKNVQVAVTFYAANGNVVGADSMYVNADLVPGQTVPYTISTFNNTLEYDHCVVQGEGYTN